MTAFIRRPAARQVELVYRGQQVPICMKPGYRFRNHSSGSPSMILGDYGETLSLIAESTSKRRIFRSLHFNTNPLITANNPYYFSAAYSEARQGDALADFLCLRIRVW